MNAQQAVRTEQPVQWDRKGNPIMWERRVDGGWWFITAGSATFVSED